jgi:hypothetical protein
VKSATTSPKCAVPSCTNRARYAGHCTPHYYERAAGERRVSLTPHKEKAASE